MATKLAKMGPMGGMHTSGIFSDMTVDGPEIGTLVVIVDRAKNLPNRKTMGKQDPYCAARLGKEAKKTETDRRGGQTPRWDQELRFTVHESPDYYNLKVSVFNDDRKTELIGETFITLQDVITPGGGQSDTWHSLNCKGKYAGEIRLELTYYDTRPKEEKAVERKPVRTTASDIQVPSTIGPREITPVKRRPLPSNPTGASPSSASRAYNTPPRQQPIPQAQPTPTHRHTYYGGQRTADDRRPLPGTAHPTPRHADQQRASYYEPQHARSHGNLPDPAQNYQDVPPQQEPEYPTSYAHDEQMNAPIGATPPVPRHINHHHQSPQPPPVEENRYVAYSPAQHGDRRSSYANAPHVPHSYSEPAISHHYSTSTDMHQSDRHSPYRASSSDQYNGTSYPQLDPYRPSSSQFDEYNMDPHEGHSPVYSQGYQESPMHSPHYGYDASAHNTMQPTVEDEDDIPPPPPVHRSSAPPAPSYDAPPPHFQPDLTPAPLRISPSRDDMRRPSYSEERGYTHSAGGHPRPVSRDSMRHSPLGNELVPAYDTTSQARRLSYSEYNTPPNYNNPARPHAMSHYESTSPRPSSHYQGTPEAAAPMVKPRAISPSVADPRAGRMPNRSTPTRKSVSPRPPPSVADSERRLSSIPFSPDSFDELNPRLAATKSSGNSPNESSSASIVGFDGRVIDPSDHLPVDSWAPEPEPKGKDKDRAKRPTRDRIVMGARDIHRRDLSDQDIRNAVMHSNRSSPAFNGHAADVSPHVPGSGSAGRNRLQKKPRSGTADSMSLVNGLNRDYENVPSLPRASPSHERHEQHYAYSPSPYSAGTRPERRALPPPIPAKIPLHAPDVRGDELARLSAEMSTIDIGMGTTRRGGARAMGGSRVRDGMGIGRYG